MVEFQNLSKSKFSKKFFINIADRILKKDYLLSVVFLDKKEIQKINKKYMKKDKPTDVLSFENKKSDFPDRFIGEIIICPEVVKEQAVDTYKAELKKVFIHGILHLQGYDHKKDQDFKKMHRKENFYNKHIV